MYVGADRSVVRSTKYRSATRRAIGMANSIFSTARMETA